MNSQFRRGVLELCVLSLVYKEDVYGYEVVQKISKYIDVNEGTIYPILRRLTKEGYFETYILESNEGPARKYYRMTVAGIQQYKNMKTDWDQFIVHVTNLINENQ